MSFYSLPLERQNVDVPKEYCYLVITKYPEDHFKPQKGKKLSSQELKEKKEKISKQESTIEQLNTGHVNLHNNKIKIDTIFNSWFTSYIDNSNQLIYRIKTVASNSNTNYSTKTYEVSEFDIIKQLKTREEVIDQIHKDNLLREFSATVFDNYSYANEGYNLKLYEWFEYIKKTFDNYKISLSDIMITNDYYHVIRSKFNKKDTYELTRINIRYLLNNGLIEYFREGDYYKTKLIIGLIECGLYDIALDCIKLLEGYDLESILKDKDFEIVLRKWSNIKEVKEIISLLDIKLKGVTLKVIKDNYENYLIEEKTFDNIGEVKTYLIKNYDVSFEQVMNKDICDLSFYDGDTEIKFELI